LTDLNRYVLSYKLSIFQTNDELSRHRLLKRSIILQNMK